MRGRTTYEEAGQDGQSHAAQGGAAVAEEDREGPVAAVPQGGQIAVVLEEAGEAAFGLEAGNQPAIEAVRGLSFAFLPAGIRGYFRRDGQLCGM